jgi:hypothetical protein
VPQSDDASPSRRRSGVGGFVGDLGSTTQSAVTPHLSGNLGTNGRMGQVAVQLCRGRECWRRHMRRRASLPCLPRLPRPQNPLKTLSAVSTTTASFSVLALQPRSRDSVTSRRDVGSTGWRSSV